MNTPSTNHQTIESRFWAKVQKTDGCWFWSGYLGTNDYGRFWVSGRLTKAHRYAYELLVGVIPSGMQIDHICHNRACVNPIHLRLATHAENMRNSSKRSNNRSGFKNVHASRNKKAWVAYIKVNGIKEHLGTFPTPQLAHAAYCKAAIRLHGEFAKLE